MYTKTPKTKLERNGEIVELSQQPHIDAFLQDGWKLYAEPEEPEVKQVARSGSKLSKQ